MSDHDKRVEEIRKDLLEHREAQAKVRTEDNEGEEFMAAWSVISGSVENQWDLLAAYDAKCKELRAAKERISFLKEELTWDDVGGPQ